MIASFYLDVEDDGLLVSTIDLCPAIKPTRSGLRWLDGTLESGKRIFVDTSNLVNLTDWNKTRPYNYPGFLRIRALIARVDAMYSVIFQDTRSYGCKCPITYIVRLI